MKRIYHVSVSSVNGEDESSCKTHSAANALSFLELEDHEGSAVELRVIEEYDNADEMYARLNADKTK